MMHAKSCTKGTVVRLSQWRKRRMLDWRLFRSWNGWFFYVQNEKNVVYGKIWQLYNPKLRVNRLRVIRIRKVRESMRFDSGPEGFVRVNRNYVLTEYVLNENDCISNVRHSNSKWSWRKVTCSKPRAASLSWMWLSIIKFATKTLVNKQSSMRMRAGPGKSCSAEVRMQPGSGPNTNCGLLFPHVLSPLTSPIDGPLPW